ncbi:MAG: YceD family protein, partial [Rubrivivax sp.]
MKPVVFNPRRLEVAAFAKAQARLEGRLALVDLPRLAEGLLVIADEAPAAVNWQAAGSMRQVLGGSPETRLHLQARARVWLTCQRCLGPMAQELQVDRSFRFVRDEDEAAQLDETTDDEDVLSMGRPLDLWALVEDELIMSLPIVPRHETCPAPLSALAPLDHEPDRGASASSPAQAGQGGRA